MALSSFLRNAVLGAALVLSAAAPAMAEPPAQRADQVGGWHRFKLGGFEVTALYDGYIDLKLNTLLNIEGKTVEALLRQRGLDLYHLGLSKGGLPKHPLYIGYETQPVLWA